MTTREAAACYAADHARTWNGRPYAIYNPHNREVSDLPIIYGFNNGGNYGWMRAILLAENGAGLGGHICTEEGYMPYDLGCIEGSRPDRHEQFREHYPDGYRMEFIGADRVMSHEGLRRAYELNKQWKEK